MPVFEFAGVSSNSPVKLALDVIGGTWKMPILRRLENRVWRYGELQCDLGTVNHKMLTQQLRERERDGLVVRTVFPVVPPHVEYTLTPLGASAIPCIEVLRTWGAQYRAERSCTHTTHQHRQPSPRTALHRTSRSSPQVRRSAERARFAARPGDRDGAVGGCG
jgi:DNA-binding HxlR family transcriptional regulator